MDDAYVDKMIMSATNCVPGMTLMQSVVDENTGSVIIGKGHKLTKENIERLKNFEHTQVWVRTETDGSFWDIKPETYEVYKSYAEEIRNVFSSQKNFGVINLQQFTDISKKMVKNFNSEYEALGCIGLLPKLQKDIYYHSINIAFLSLLIGKWQGYNEYRLEQLVLAALLHDIGKMDMESKLFDKREPEMLLSERIEYRRHPIYGYDILVKFDELDIEVLKAVLSHHECIDGSGYPLSLRGDKLNEYCKIISIADTYDRLKERYHIFDVIKFMTTSMIKKFDIDIVTQFCTNVANYYVDSYVLLNNGKIGQVSFIQTQAIHKPIVRVGEENIDLYENTSIEIVKIL